jgi:spore maturation protein CgeB
MTITILGLSITSSWGNGHATTYRSLVHGLALRGHDVLFLERDVPWYAGNRDLPQPPYGRTELYFSIDDLKTRFGREIRQSDLTIVGSYVPEGVSIGECVTTTAEGATAFYDIDTPVTLAKLERGDYEYLSPSLIRRYDYYFSFTGGPTLKKLEQTYGAPAARVLYCSVNPDLYYREKRPIEWDLGYIGTYSEDRQRALDGLLVKPARAWTRGRFIVAGPMYPSHLRWPSNVARTEHLAPGEHRRFYASQRYTLNVTRADMVAAGYSPSVRLFEAAACGTPIITDYWKGLETLFTPGKEILVARSTKQVLSYLIGISETERQAIASRAQARVLAAHTGVQRAMELESHVNSVAFASPAV